MPDSHDDTPGANSGGREDGAGARGYHELTKRLAAPGLVMGIDLVDHIVLSDSRYCSFKEMGRL